MVFATVCKPKPPSGYDGNQVHRVIRHGLVRSLAATNWVRAAAARMV